MEFIKISELFPCLSPQIGHCSQKNPVATSISFQTLPALLDLLNHGLGSAHTGSLCLLLFYFMFRCVMRGLKTEELGEIWASLARSTWFFFQSVAKQNQTLSAWATEEYMECFFRSDQDADHWMTEWQEADHWMTKPMQEELAAFRKFSLSFPAPIPTSHFLFFSPAEAVGLYNLGLTCCLNSLLQVFFMNIHFTRILRRYLLEFPLLPCCLHSILDMGCVFGGLDHQGAVGMLFGPSARCLPCCVCHTLTAPAKAEVAVFRLGNNLWFISWTESLWLVPLFSLTGYNFIPGLLTGHYNKGCVTCSHTTY